MSQSGLYLHIPFCKSRCTFCDFYFVTSQNKRLEFLQAIKGELALHRQQQSFPFKDIDTIYFGGGTPSLLTPDEFEMIFESIHRNFNVHPQAEITVEVNPGLKVGDYFKRLKRMGVNRVSLGVQSFNDELLKWMNRDHDVMDVFDTVAQLKDAYINDFSIDLLHSVPNQSLDELRHSLESAISLRPKHISLYNLTVEENTPLFSKVHQGEETAVEEDESHSHMMLGSLILEDAGYTHYELSSFAKSDTDRSAHNSKYWKHIPYLGVGPSSHSFDGERRWWNQKSMSGYCDSVKREERPIETVDEMDKGKFFLETILLSLRNDAGLDLKHISQEYGIHFKRDYKDIIQPLLKEHYATLSGNILRLTTKGYTIYNHLVAKFARVEVQ